MKLSSLLARDSFALFGPGFSREGQWTLIDALTGDSKGTAPSGDRLVFAPYEASGRDAVVLGGESTAVEAIEFDATPAMLDPQLDATGHSSGVETIREAIAAGDVYQVNLTLRARLECESGAALLSTLCRTNVPRFCAWVRFPDGSELVSASPELFFQIEGRTLRAEPMKGTASTDAAGHLDSSEKDRAELAMITDLLRNDLTAICLPRTVRVPNERRFIQLPYAIQTVSDVEGQLPAGVDVLEVLEALHPGGSITGAPKAAAMELIQRLEPTPRGAYCGALGLVRQNEATFSILIRTAERAAGDATWTYGVGGGIVWDSDPALELEEARIKLGALGWRTPR